MLKSSYELQNRYVRDCVDSIIFFDEKLFPHNKSNNGKIYAIHFVTFDDIPENLRTIKRLKTKISLTVKAVVSGNGKLNLKFIDKGLNINALNITSIKNCLHIYYHKMTD